MTFALVKFDILKDLTDLDDQGKMQYLNEMNEFIQKQAGIIQNKNQAAFAEVITESESTSVEKVD